MRKLKLYLETSVWNFYYANDALEKQAITRQFFHSLPNDKSELANAYLPPQIRPAKSGYGVSFYYSHQPEKLF